MIFEIDTHDFFLARDLMETSSPSPLVGQKRTLPGGATVTFEGIIERRALDFPSTIQLVVSFGKGVLAGVVASWLYNKIKGRASTLRIDRTEVEIEEGEIKRIIKEKIQIED